MMQMMAQQAGCRGLVSIIIPAYQAQERLPAALASIREQTYRQWEVVVVEDPIQEGLRDGTEGIVQAFAAEVGADRVQYHVQVVNQGVSATRNQALALARGEYLALLDHDDRWRSFHLAQMVEALEAGTADLLYCTSEKFADGTGAALGPCGPTTEDLAQFPGSLLQSCYIPASSVVMRRSIPERIGGFDTSLRAAEDLDYWLRALAAGFRIQYLPYSSAFYRQQNRNALTAKTAIVLEWHTRVLYKHHQLAAVPAGERYKTLARYSFGVARRSWAERRQSPGQGLKMLKFAVLPWLLSPRGAWAGVQWFLADPDRKPVAASSQPQAQPQAQAQAQPQPQPQPNVTIVVVARERFSYAQRSLESLYEIAAGCPFKLIYVDGNAPSQVRQYLRRQAEEKGFTLIRQPVYLSPNRARNLAIAAVTTPYVVFVDNDILVRPNWLKALVDCAEQTQAWAVGPLTLEGEGFDTVHQMGGKLTFTEPKGQRWLIERRPFMHLPLAKFQQVQAKGGASLLTSEAYRTELTEFHCVLARTEIFGTIGRLDENLLSIAEETDFCLSILKVGGSIYAEPNSIVTYVPPATPAALSWQDYPFYLLRWSGAWCEQSALHFQAKWQLSASAPTLKNYRYFVYSHRQLAFGGLNELTLKKLAQDRTLTLRQKWVYLAKKVLHKVMDYKASFGEPV
jgi:GT2 family glycosyltransferase